MKFAIWTQQDLSYICWQFGLDRLSSCWVTALQIQKSGARLFKQAHLFSTIRYSDYSTSGHVICSKPANLFHGLKWIFALGTRIHFRLNLAIGMKGYFEIQWNLRRDCPKCPQTLSFKTVVCWRYIWLYQIEQLPWQGRLLSQVGLLLHVSQYI